MKVSDNGVASLIVKPKSNDMSYNLKLWCLVVTNGQYGLQIIIDKRKT